MSWLGVVSKGNQTLFFYDYEFTYNTIYDYEPLVSVFIWSGIAVLNILITFWIWVWFYNSYIDLVSFILNLGLYGYHLYFFVMLVAFDNLDSGEWRGKYYESAMIAFAGPLALWPLTNFAYFIHSWIYLEEVYKNDFSYVAVKLFLFFLYNIGVGFYGLETLFNIYDYWQVIAKLAVKVPYTRPTEEEVEQADKLVEENVFEI